MTRVSETYISGVAHQDGVGIHPNGAADLVFSRRNIHNLIFINTA